MVFSWINARRLTKTKKIRNLTTVNTSTFLLEPILTPSAGIDGGDSIPDVAILRSDADVSALVTLPDHHADTWQIDHSQDSDGSDVGALEIDSEMDRPALSTLPYLPKFDSGVFTVGSSGEVAIDFLFDGGGYQGELAVFSLDGLEGSNLSREEFIQQVAQRALSNSELGHIVVSDVSEGARFSGELAWEGNFNGGEYQGVKSFQMRAGDRVGFMLVPNGRVEDVLNSPMEGAIRPLFSMASIDAGEDLNPGQTFYMEQIVDVTGEGNTFAFEDLRVDTGSDRDYNDMVFQVRGARGEAVHLDQVIDPSRDWRTTDTGQALISYTEPYITPDATSPTDNWLPSDDISSEISLPLPFEFPRANQPMIGVIDTAFNADNPYLDYSRILSGIDRIDGDSNSLTPLGIGDEHGTQMLGIIGATQDYDSIDGVNDDAPLWVARAVGSGKWAESLVEFVDAAKASGQPNAIANLSFDLVQLNPDGSVTTRYELTPIEHTAIEYARQNGVLIVASAGNENAIMSALGQAAQRFDNILTVGSAQDFDASLSYAQGFERADYSSYGNGLGIVAEGGTDENPSFSTYGDGIEPIIGTSVATAKVTGAASLVWAANPGLSYRQVIEILKTTATDLKNPSWDDQTGAGLLNIAAAVHLAKATKPESYTPSAVTISDTWSGEEIASAFERPTATPFMGKLYEWERYTIRSGDTLSDIALRTMGNGSAPYYNFIAQRNGIPNPNVIRPGQQILIPRLVQAAPPPPERWGQVSSRVGSVPLNFRRSAQVGNNLIGTLPIGTRFKILEEVNGGAYAPGNRTTWYKIEVNGQQGFVATYYVDLVNQNPGGNPGGNPGNNPGQRILDAVDRVNPDQWYYRPRDITGDYRPETFCNWFAADVLELLGVRLPINGNQLMTKPHPLYGNQNHSKPIGTDGLYSFFRRGGGSYGGQNWGGWRHVSATEAVARANEGKAVVASSSGHIAVVIPGGTGSNVRIAQAGASNGKNMSVREGFGSITPLYFEYIG